MADKSPANQMSELLTCMETGISNGLFSLMNLDMADVMMRLKTNKITLSVIKIDLRLTLWPWKWTFK